MANAAVTAPGQSTALAVNQITLDHPWEWLAKGWKDLASVPRFSLLYGSVFLLVSYALTLGLMSRDLFFNVPPLAAGFFPLAPVLGICTLYLVPWPDRDHAPGRPCDLARPTGFGAP
jgi:uncharacterized membrane protein